MPVNTPTLVDHWEDPRQGNARVWLYEDGRYLFELVRRDGKCLSVFLPSREDVLALWSRLWEEDEDQDSPS